MAREPRIVRTPEEFDGYISRKRHFIPLNMSVRGKLALATALPVMLLLVGASAILGKQFSDLYHEQVRERCAAHVRMLAVPVGRALSVQALDRLDGYLTQATAASMDSLPLLAIGVLDSTGSLVAHSEPGAYRIADGAGKSLTTSLMLPFGEFSERAADIDFPHWWRHRNSAKQLVLDISMPATSGLRWGTLIARFDLSNVDRQRRLTLQVMVALALLLTLTIVMALRLSIARIVVEPIDELARSAHEITRGRLDTRAWVVGGDEIAGLARDFNTMADELQSYTESLERKVEERSAEVQRKNTELEAVNERLQTAFEELERIATTDPLTGAANRRRFQEALDFEFRRAERRKLPFSLIMTDVDNFKHYNDTNGHQAGDRALQDLTKTLAAELRATDLLARYGGEEFVGLLLDTPKEGAVQVAETLRKAILAHDFECGASQPGGRVTGSFGVATFPDDARDGEGLLLCADKALYLAKAAGRNKVIAWGPETARAEKNLAAASQHQTRDGKTRTAKDAENAKKAD